MDSVYLPENFPSPILLDRFYSEPEHIDITLIRGVAVSLFDSITLPSLSQLRVHYSGAAGFNQSVIRSLVLRSSRILQRLCIKKRHIYDEDPIPCLESVPSLSHLRLVVLGESAGLSKNFVFMMHPSRDSGPPLLPKLAWFHRVTATHLWTSCQKDAAHNQPKTETLSQSPPSTQLKSFIMRDTISRTTRLTKVGMDLSIRSLL